MTTTDLSRRAFLRRVAAAGGASFITRTPPFHAAVPVFGHVTSGGRGVAGVGVTDGLTVVETNAAGRFDLAAGVRQPWVYLTVPSGYGIPQSRTGTAAFFRRRPASGAIEFELEQREAGRHAFLALADPQTQNAREMRRFHDESVPDVIATITELGVDDLFGVACGDIMFDDLSLYPEYERAVDRMGIPFFQVVGNHDLDLDAMVDPASTATFESRFGPRYYSFERGDAHYIVLDDVFWNHAEYVGYLDADQLAWLAADLGRVDEGSLVVVFAHIPALCTQYRRNGSGGPGSSVSITNRDALYALLSPYNAHIISGHTHENEHVFEGDVHEHILGAACGAWWTGPICHDGAPNGYAVFEVDGHELRWRYKATGHPASHQIRAYARGSDPSAPDEIVANVWDWDPTWTVTWYENGVRRGEMARRIGTDPLSELLHGGPDLPPTRPWVNPLRTEHLFYAPTSAGSGALVVEAVNRWGDIFTANPADVQGAAPR